MAVKSVGIANRYCGYRAVALQYSFPAVAHSLLLRHLAQLQYCCLQRAHGVQYVVVAAVNAVESESQSAGVELAFGEVLYARTVADVAQNLVVKGGLQFRACLVEELELTCREIVEVVAVASHEMREHRAWYYGVLPFQPVYNPVNVPQGVEAKAVHTRVELYVYGISCYSLLFGSLYQGVHKPEAIHLWLQFVVEHCLEGCHFGIHYHYVARDAVFPQCHSLVSHCHGKIVHAVVLQCLCHFHGTSSIGVSLHHAYNFCSGFH